MRAAVREVPLSAMLFDCSSDKQMERLKATSQTVTGEIPSFVPGLYSIGSRLGQVTKTITFFVYALKQRGHIHEMLGSSH